MRVLLVDDEEEFVSTLSERLSFRGIDSDWTTRPEDVMEWIEQKTYEIAVLDVKMPGMSGLQLKNLLQERFPDLKFIFLTGHGSEEDFKAIMEDGGTQYYLVKPIQIEELVAKMNEIKGA
ncbi:MAG: response regulator [Planctomycetes bacterium]|nr:response regulator [Planctomycetota bacterium]